MKFHKILPVFLFTLLSFALFAQCPPGQNEIRLEINADEYWYEVHWTIQNNESGVIYATGDLTNTLAQEFIYCIPDDECATFKIIDDYGDGMAPDGYYRLYLNGVLIKETIGNIFYTTETTTFGCPPGSSCESAFPADLGAWATPNGNQHWYRFVPQATGLYEINTCDSLNACGSKIWVYSQCQGIVLSNNQTGADYYADGGCANGALATLALEAGEDYYIRLRYEPSNCDTTPLNFVLSYVGPITGCTDPTACNYNPLATVSDTCLYPGNPDCPQAPDLVTRQDVFRNSLEFTTIDNGDACAVEEGCIRGLGIRHLIEFTTYIENIGEQDYYIGMPPSDINTPSNQFVFDPCHNHWHYLGYAGYVLFDANGYRVPIGSKTGFCVLDLTCPPGIDAQYGCNNMGITAGCADIYDKGLPCQWIDITDIPAGDYTMVIRVNWDRSPDVTGRFERDYKNNWAQACFTLTYSNGIPDVVFNFDQCPDYTDCAGEVFGDAQPDCNGVCNGTALHGDWNQDTIRNAADAQGYLAAAVANSGDANSCLDLDDNGSINVYDAALQQECALHQEDPQYWIQAFPCQFPTGFNNTQDLVAIKPGSVDTVAKTFDIEIANPFNTIMGYEFSVSGLVISSVENLAAGFVPDLRFNAATGEIVALGLTETAIMKHATPGNFLRIHYSALTAPEVCVAQITAVVNSKYQLSSASVANPNCVSVVTSGVFTPENAAFEVYVQPNPFIEKASIFFENETAEPMRVELRDVTGQTVRSFEGVRGTSVTFERNNLPAGTYFFTVSGNKGKVTGKVMAQ